MALGGAVKQCGISIAPDSLSKDASWNLVGKLISHLIQPSCFTDQETASERRWVLLKVTQLVRLAALQIMDVKLSWTIKATYRPLHLFEIIFLLIPFKILPNAIPLS